MSPISLSTSVAGIEAFCLAAGHRADRGRDRGQRAHGAANHQQRCEQPDQHAGGAEHDALPLRFRQRPGEIARQHVAAARADLAQQFGDALDQAAFGAQHLLVDIGDLPLADRDADDRLGIAVDGLRSCGSGIVIARMLWAAGSAADGLCASSAEAIRLWVWDSVARYQRIGLAAIAVSNRSRNGGSATIISARRLISADIRSIPLAVGRQPLGDAVDHVLLLGGELQPGLLQDLAERVAASPTWTDWVPGSVTKSRAASRSSFMRRSMSSARSPTLCSRCSSAKVESMWRMAMTLAVEVMMITASTSMKLPNVSWPIESENDRVVGEFGGDSVGHVIEAGLQSAAIYDVFRAMGNMLELTVKGDFRAPRNRRPGRQYPALGGDSSGKIAATTAGFGLCGSIGRNAGLLNHLGPHGNVGLDDIGDAGSSGGQQGHAFSPGKPAPRSASPA